MQLTLNTSQLAALETAGKIFESTGGKITLGYSPKSFKDDVNLFHVTLEHPQKRHEYCIGHGASPVEAFSEAAAKYEAAKVSTPSGVRAAVREILAGGYDEEETKRLIDALPIEE